MKFDLLNAEFVRLRYLLRVFVDEKAIDEISIQAPKGEGEASFLRLVAWSYVLMFEAGKVAVPYLIGLPSDSNLSRPELEAKRELIHDLRTWSFHNLDLVNRRSHRISQRTALWFIDVCGSSPPRDAIGWRSCYRQLCFDVHAVLAHCRNAMDMAVVDEDVRQLTIDEMKRRLERDWPAHKFDRLISDAATRMGMKLNVSKFRQTKQGKWKQVLRIVAEDDNPESLIVRLIERDLLDYFGETLPVDGKDIMLALGIAPGHEVAEQLRIARQLYASGVTGKGELLARLSQ